MKAAGAGRKGSKQQMADRRQRAVASLDRVGRSSLLLTSNLSTRTGDLEVRLRKRQRAKQGYGPVIRGQRSGVASRDSCRTWTGV